MTSRDEYLESMNYEDNDYEEESLFSEEEREYYDNVLSPQVERLNRW